MDEPPGKRSPLVFNPPLLPGPETALAAQERRLHKRLALAIATKAIIACVYQVGERRNTWGGTFVYRADRSFVTMAAAQQSVETERKMGSSWRIRELPACAFTSGDESLVVADSDIEPRVPLRVHAYDATCRPYLAAIRNAFNHPLPARLRLLARTHEVNEAKSFREWASETFGGQYRLSWAVKREEPFDLSAVRRIVEIHAESQRSLAFWGLIREDSKTGSVIQELHPKSPLALQGLQVGDVITHASNLTQQRNQQSLSAVIEAARPGDVVTVSVRREAVFELRIHLTNFRDAFS